MPLVLERGWIGMRITVRRAVDRGPEGRIRFSDVVGELLHLDEQHAVIEARDGVVEVPLATVVAAKPAPPSTRDELDLEAVVAQGWRPAETGHIGAWLLRANGGFTGRANSVLPLGPPGRPLDDALRAAHAWYAERGLPLRLQVPTDARRLLDAELGERGWPASPDVDVMVARLSLLTADGAAREAVSLTDRPDESWLRRYRDGAGALAAARELLLRHDRVAFAFVREEGETIAIARGTVDGEWLGITAVEVAPARRRNGYASAVTSALWGWGASRGAVRTHVEVSTDNEAAMRLYERLGYRRHHSYRYRTEPDAVDA
jgi:ribosomal protein S18 acetylase RimI-like enzyme